MKTRIKHKRFPFLLLVGYPLVDIAYNTFAREIHGSTFNILYFLLFIICTLAFYRYLINKSMIICFSICILYVTFSYDKSGTILLQFFLFLIICIIFSNDRYMGIFKEYLLYNSKLIIIVMSIYLSVLLYSIFFLEGLQTGWGTIVIYGPYDLSHTLAYEMLAFVILSLYKFKNDKSKIWLCFAAIFEMLIILTCVRSALLASVFVLFSFSLSFNLKTKMYLFIAGALLALVLLYNHVFDQIIEKTKFAMGNGSITNGREWIIDSSMTIFKESSLLEKIFGSGYDNLLRGNLKLLGTAIQGHNDLITVLISFGIVGLIIYLNYLWLFLKGKGWFFCTLSLVCLLYFNGLFLYSPIVIELGVVRIYFKMVKAHTQDKKNSMRIMKCFTKTKN